MRHREHLDGKARFKIHFPAQSALGPWLSKYESFVARWTSSQSVFCHNWVSASSSNREMTQHQLWEESVVSLFSHFLQLPCLEKKTKRNLTKPNQKKESLFLRPLQCFKNQFCFKSRRLSRVNHILLTREKASWQILFCEWTQRK